MKLSAILFLILIETFCLNFLCSKELRKRKTLKKFNNRLQVKLSIAELWAEIQKEISIYSWYNIKEIQDKFKVGNKDNEKELNYLLNEFNNNNKHKYSQSKSNINKQEEKYYSLDSIDDKYYSLYEEKYNSKAFDWRFGFGYALSKVDILRQQRFTRNLLSKSNKLDINELRSLRKLSGSIFTTKNNKLHRKCGASLIPNQVILDFGPLIIRTAAHCLLNEEINNLFFTPYDQTIITYNTRETDWLFRLQGDFIMDRMGNNYTLQEIKDKWEKAKWSERWALDNYITLTISPTSVKKMFIGELFHNQITPNISLEDDENISSPSLLYFAFPSGNMLINDYNIDKNKYLLTTNILASNSEHYLENKNILYDEFKLVCPNEFRNLPVHTNEENECQKSFSVDKYKKAAYLPMFRGASGAGIALCGFASNNNKEKDNSNSKNKLLCKIIGVLHGSHLIKKDENSDVEFMGIIAITKDSISKDQIIERIFNKIKEKKKEIEEKAKTNKIKIS